MIKIMIKRLFEKLTGLDKIKAEAAAEAAESLKLAREAQEAAEEAKKLKEESEAAAHKAAEEEEIAKMSPKERATRKEEPWVGVLETHINKENLRNGFFELDWNEYFVLQLRQAGYGFDGDPDEEVVDRWFRNLCKDIGSEEGIDMTDRGAGYINVKKIAEGKSEVS
jgi:hypothetical protein